MLDVRTAARRTRERREHDRECEPPEPLALPAAIGNRAFAALVARSRADHRSLARVKAPVTQLQVTGMVGNPFQRILQRYSISFGGTTITVSYAGLGEVGHITGGEKDGVASVTNVVVGSEFRGSGVAKLLAAAFYAYWSSKGASDVNLGTQDTSGGFWAHLGMSSAAIPIATAWTKLGAINVEQTLVRGEPQFTDYSKRIII